MNQTIIRALPHLQRVYDRDNAIELEETKPDIYTALRCEIIEGATPDEVERFISALSGYDTDYYARQLKSAARHITAQVENEKKANEILERHERQTA